MIILWFIVCFHNIATIITSPTIERLYVETKCLCECLCLSKDVILSYCVLLVLKKIKDQ